MTTHHRQTLTAVGVFNTAGTPSLRYVDAALFEFWRHWMEHRHDFQISYTEQYVWIPFHEESRHHQVFTHCKDRKQVTRLGFASFNEETQQTEHRARFVATEDLDQVTGLLKQHFGGPQIHTAVDTMDGYAITTRSRHNPTAAYIASSWSMPRGFAPVRSAMRS